MNYQITRVQPTDPLPNQLLLLGDENQALIDAYLPYCQVYLLSVAKQVRGICLLQVDEKLGEIRNVAVEPAYQGKGLGKALLQAVIEAAREQGVEQLLIKTGNSGIGQLALYQRLGFELIDVHYNYFLTAYPQPIWENGIQCKHQLVLAMTL